jgi:hypothetical protein
MAAQINLHPKIRAAMLTYSPVFGLLKKLTAIIDSMINRPPAAIRNE